MILKETDDKATQLAELSRLLSISAPTKVTSKIQAELRMLRAGIKGEQESCFHLDSKFKDSKNAFVLHDLRFEHNGQVAQIDHLLINRMMGVFVIETKHFHAGLKIHENGEFEQWVSRMKTYVGMASPLEQNQRHIDVLKKVFSEKIEMPTRLGIQFQPTFYSRVLVNPTAKIIRPKQFDSSDVVKADAFFSKYNQDYDKAGVFESLSQVAKIVKADTVKAICNQLIKFHKPITINYAAKFGIEEKPVEKINETPKKIQQEPAAYSAHKCSKCNSHKVRIESGRYGYYFKCGECSGNTAIKVNCGVDKHQERIQKKGNKFYRVCAECETRTLYFENEA